MKANVGRLDQIIRFILGIGLLSLVLVVEGNIKYIGFIGVVPLLTGLIKFCPLYPIFGINTCQMKSQEKTSTLHGK